ncbi:glycoside hydrolase family 2 TIM barrel-domain containing protein [Tamlana sp. 2201CG12-4]|uniref:glycoside hydrolase family 2 TIM barrel-domain containing protein n=1 Tax=Tamlana sp. 2201CG12-4 TaxID=3112582 RepID=UPI002DB9480C|nr:glycoside hydrolase family 2 TIM barrel-domain containing protein [Tamlana sp. 2201CG12-4]MEC3906254.1 glycoside hydrolase family 2 TIM barrel-domain containing protein [Tamlana sp. 2201CG12-4]
MILNKTVILIFTGLLLSCNPFNKANIVKVSERNLLVNDSAYIIKGICYHPVAKGATERGFDSLTQDLELMKEAGINTIRVYAPIDDIAVLDEIDKAGIKVIIGFGYNQNGVFDIKSGSFIDYVNTYKNHPAILMWELGNEYNYHPQWFEGDLANWYKAMNQAAYQIHQVDRKHPTTTAHGELPDEIALKSCPEIDVWGMNVYRWDSPGNIFDEWKKISNKPMYLSEAGGDSYMTISKNGFVQGINESAQAQANANILKEVFENLDVCSGVAMFSFTDGWWKAGNPETQDVGGWAPNSTGVPYDGTPNEEYWGIVDIDRNKKETFEIIKSKYRQIHN